MSETSRKSESMEGLKNFKEIKRVEIQKAINTRRSKLDLEAAQKNMSYPESDGNDLVGLALSGGGIRSAMFNLGLLQSMQRAGFLKHVDYISSVSGGGYTNGYYSTLGSKGAISSGDEDCGLSAKDSQFLLDGQYLNRPTEFMTDYLFKTALVVGTVLSSMIFVASLIAIYFRLFDQPSVRRWLGLLDLNTDLRVGIFASILPIVVVLTIRGVYRYLLIRFKLVPAPTPGRWALITLGFLMLGVAVMIGNGDFFVSDALGFLPDKIDLKGFQLPIAITVILLFLPLLKVGALVKSERITASIWQRAAFWVILLGATWGSFFVTVGYMGQENLSGIITDRPPELLRYDLFSAERAASVLGDLELQDKMKLKLNSVEIGNLNRIVELPLEIYELGKQRHVLELALREDKYRWDTWLNFDSNTFERWITTVLGLSGFENQARKYIDIERALADEKGDELVSLFNAAIRPSNLPNPSKLNDNNGSETPKFSEADRDLTRFLLTRAARKVALRTENLPENLRSIVAANPNNNQISRELLSIDVDHVSVHYEILNRWVAQGAPMPRKSSSDPMSFRDLSQLKSILEILAPAWTNLPLSSSRKTIGYSVDASEPNPSSKNPPTTRPIDLLTPFQLWQFNRLLLEIAYPEVFKERLWVSTSVTITEDQSFRWAAVLVSGLMAVVGILLVDFNQLSPWFLFYRKRVYETFLSKAGQKESEASLCSLTPCAHGHPYPLFVGGLLIPQAPGYRFIQEDNINPSKLDGSFGSQWYSFLMSPLYVGWLPATSDPKLLEQKTYRSTEQYLQGTLSVSDAIVLSGAAISTFMSSNPALRVLMQVFNVRLEQWLPNPTTLSQPLKRSALLFWGTKYVRFNTFQLLKEFWKSSKWKVPDSSGGSWGYGVVADGGFREFLGVEELVARRCRIIVASDAGCNNGLYEFGVLADLIRKLRLDHGVEILDLDHDKPLDTKRLARTGKDNSISPQHYIVGRIRYPENRSTAPPENANVHMLDAKCHPPEVGLFVYVQMSLTGDEDIDIGQFKRTNPQFPDEPISNQFYSKDQVESFRQLGEHIGKLLCWDIDKFDCPFNSAESSKKQMARDWRIETIDRAFREAYRSECRQEAIVATDDAMIGWMFDGKRPDMQTSQLIHRFESSRETDHQIITRNFVWHCTDGYQREDSSEINPYFDFDSLKAADLYGIAIESNRRHSGFRPEWPTAFFQINGRDLLMRAAQRANDLLTEINYFDLSLQERLHPTNRQTEKLLTEFSRLAVMLVRGVFRLDGEKTATDVLVCMLNLGLKIPHEEQDPNSVQWNATKDILLHLRSQHVQCRIRTAVKTGNALEVQCALKSILFDHEKLSQDKPPNNNHKSDCAPQSPSSSMNKPR